MRNILKHYVLQITLRGMVWSFSIFDMLMRKVQAIFSHHFYALDLIYRFSAISTFSIAILIHTNPSHIIPLYQQTNYSQRFKKISGTRLLDQTAFTLLWLKPPPKRTFQPPHTIQRYSASKHSSQLMEAGDCPAYPKDPSSPDSHRPIALTCVLGKLFQKSL